MWPWRIASRYGDCAPPGADGSAPRPTSSSTCSVRPLLAATCNDVQPSFHGSGLDASTETSTGLAVA